MIFFWMLLVVFCFFPITGTSSIIKINSRRSVRLKKKISLHEFSSVKTRWTRLFRRRNCAFTQVQTWDLHSCQSYVHIPKICVNSLVGITTKWPLFLPNRVGLPERNY
jgi:phage anti-repressor protein